MERCIWSSLWLRLWGWIRLEPSQAHAAFHPASPTRYVHGSRDMKQVPNMHEIAIVSIATEEASSTTASFLRDSFVTATAIPTYRYSYYCYYSSSSNWELRLCSSSKGLRNHPASRLRDRGGIPRATCKRRSVLAAGVSPASPAMRPPRVPACAPFISFNSCRTAAPYKPHCASHTSARCRSPAPRAPGRVASW